VSTYILWDIDGTLIYNSPQAGTLYRDSIEQVTGVGPTVRVQNPHGMTEGQLLLEILTVNGLDAAHLPAILLRLDELSALQHETGWTRDACVGVPEALAAVAGRGWTNALLTGNGPTRARYKLLAAGIDVELFDWDHSFFGAESPTRHHLTAGARDALAGSAAFIVGDTPKDGEAADSAGIPFIAVATGAYTADELRPTSALVVVADLASGLDAVLGAIDQSIGTASAGR
jgi:phosphoglycolate phosphatase-like HAD superfamily hydrolase